MTTTRHQKAVLELTKFMREVGTAAQVSVHGKIFQAGHSLAVRTVVEASKAADLQQIAVRLWTGRLDQTACGVLAMSDVSKQFKVLRKAACRCIMSTKHLEQAKQPRRMAGSNSLPVSM